MELAERDKELAVLTDAMVDCAAGNGSVVLVSGAIGSGKTALLHAFSDHARRLGARVLSANASKTESHCALGVMRQLLDDLDSDSPGDVDLVGPDKPYQLSSVLLQQAEKHTLVVVVDDVNYSDRRSMQSLHHLSRRLHSARILLVLIASSRPWQAYRWFRSELFRLTVIRTIRLGMLSNDGVAQMATSVLGVPAPEAAVLEYSRMTGGNVLLLRALLDDDHDRARSATGVVTAGEAFRDAVADCLLRCEPIVREVATVLAVVGEPMTGMLLGRTVGTTAVTAVRAIDRLTSMGLLRAGQFGHEATRRAVLDTTAAAKRAATHTRVAQVLHEHGSSAPMVARHLLAGNPIEADWAVSTLMTAGEMNLADSKVTQAVDCLRLAYDQSRTNRQRLAAKSAQAAAEWRLDPVSAARHLPELARVARRDELLPAESVVLVLQHLWGGEIRAAAGMFDAAARQTPDGKGDEALATARSWLQRVSPEYFPAVGPTPDPPPGAVAGSACVNGQGLASPSVGEWLTVSLAKLLSSGVMGVTATAPVDSQTVLRQPGPPVQVFTRCTEMLQAACSGDSPLCAAVSAAVSAQSEIYRGRMARAAQSARLALTALPVRAWGILAGLPLSILITASVALGRLGDARMYLREAVPDAMIDTPFGLVYLAARGRYFTATGELNAALRDFRACGSLLVERDIDVPAFLPWRSHAAEIYLAMGRMQQAHAMMVAQMDRLGANDYRTRGISLRVLAAAGPRSERPALLRESVELLDRRGDRYEQARSLADLAIACQASGDVAEARTLMDEAGRLSQEFGFHVSATPTVADPEVPASSRTAGRALDAQIADLSNAERRVAALAVQGLSNQAIADALFITVSTVEQHLTRVYRKLGKSRRSDLPAELVDLELSSGGARTADGRRTGCTRR